MAVYEALLLNTVVPQIQAAQAGDSYVMVVNATTPALRITQTGTGDSILVEDSANPDSSPFVVTATGDVGIGTTSPVEKLHVQSSSNAIGSFRSSGASYVGVETVNSSRSYSMLVRPDVSNALVIRDETVSSNRITLDTSGRLGIGITSPAYTLDVTGSTSTARLGKLIIINDAPFLTGANIDAGSNPLGIGASGAAIVAFFSNNTERARISSDGTFRVKGAGTAGSTDAFQVAGTAPADAARITSGGNLLVGTTGQVSVEKFNVTTTGDTQAALFKNDTNNRANIVSWVATTSGNPVFNEFYTETSITNRGSISYNRAAGLIAYNTTSDYRAKDVTGPIANSGATIDALKVYNGKMKGATVERPMLIAHEAQAVTPYAVTGEKDAVDEDGKPKYQQMDVSSLVPLLIAELQSLRARVAQLEAK
jgi:hypothetical protein